MTKESNLLKIIFSLTIILYFSIVFQANAQSVIQVVLDTDSVGITIPEDFIGLSFETEKLLPGNNGNYYFSPSNKSLLALLKMLGIKSLRIGGNTADRTWYKVPNEMDIDTFFAFVKKLDGVKVIYTLRLREGDHERAGELAKYIMDNYGSFVDCFAIGNEPNVFAEEYEVFKKEWGKYTGLILSISPDAKFCGPSTTPGKTEWAQKFAKDFSNSGLIKFISQHAYPGGNGARVENQVKAREKMLSADWIKDYEKFYTSFALAAENENLPYRIEEVNSFHHGGAVDVSNTFASALWGLDYMYWWAQKNARGINFHTGDSVAAGDGNNPCLYASFVTSDSGYFVRPLGYAIKAFDITSRGSFVPLKIFADSDSINVTVYAVISQQRNLFVILINKEISLSAREVNIAINVEGKFNNAEIMYLNSSDGDLAAKSGIKLGGSEINDNAEWNGRWDSLKHAANNNELIISVPAASAALIKLSNK